MEKRDLELNNLKLSLLGIILRWGFLILEIFFFIEDFCPHQNNNNNKKQQIKKKIYQDEDKSPQ